MARYNSFSSWSLVPHLIRCQRTVAVENPDWSIYFFDNHEEGPSFHHFFCSFVYIELQQKDVIITIKDSVVDGDVVSAEEGKVIYKIFPQAL